MGRELNLSLGEKTDYYHWELIFDEYQFVVNQLNELEKPKDRRIDPQNPPSGFGRPISIRLISHQTHLQNIEITLPSKASPVCFCVCAAAMNGTKPVSGIVSFAVGYRIGELRTYKSIDPATGKVTDLTDRVPVREL